MQQRSRSSSDIINYGCVISLCKCREEKFQLNLTLHADYSLRILLYLSEHRDRPVSTHEISEAYGISRNHLVRVVQTLQSNAFINASVGRSGGLTLARDPAAINIGQVVRSTEPNFRIVECFEPATNTCRIAAVCKLRGMLAEALQAFIHVLDGYTLADVARLKGKTPLSTLLAIQKAHPRSTALHQAGRK